MDENRPLNIYAKFEIDKMQSINNIQKAVKEVGEKTTVKVSGINFDMQKVAKDFNKIVSTAFHMDKDNILTGYTTTLKNELGEILTLQSKFDENGNEYLASAKAVNNELETQKVYYEEIRKLYEKLGKLEAESVNASKKKQENLAQQVEEVNAQIKTQEKSLKKQGLTNNSLQNSVIEKQKLANERAIAQEEEKRNKKREASYDKLTKSLQLLHKYKMQSLTANESELAALERQMEIVTKARNSAQGTINRSGLANEDLDKQIQQLKEIHALELQAKQDTIEQKALNKELEASEMYLLKLKKQHASVTKEGVKTTLSKQIAEQELAIEQKKQAMEKKGISYQQTENALKQKQLEIENEIAVAQTKQQIAIEEEARKTRELIAYTQRSMGNDINNFKNRKAKYISGDDEQAIERVRIKLQELNGTSLKDVKSQIANLKLEWKEVSSTVNTTQLKEASTVVDELGNSFKKLAGYVSGAMVIQKLWEVLREGVQYVKDLDDAYTDVAISMDISRSEFNEWTKDARKIAQANGVMTTSIMDMVKIYATSGEKITDIQDKLEGTAMLQNITQWDAEKTTSVVGSIISQYKLMEKEINGTTGNMRNAIQYMGDALVGVSNALTVDNVAGIQEIASAIDVAGGIMEQAGASMEWYMGVAGTLNEVMNASGSEIGNAMKMVSARIFAQAQAMEELGESSENIEVEMRKAEKALASVGVSIREASDPSQLRGLKEILDDLAGKWDNLTDSTKNYVAEGAAGTNRRSHFITLMENYDRVLTLTNAGLEAQGALAEANAVRVESLAGQINIMKDKLMALMDGLQPVLLGLTNIGNTALTVANFFGAVPTSITLATTAFLSFNKTGQLTRDALLQMGQAYHPVVAQINSSISAMGVEKQKMTELIEKAKLKIATTQSQIIAKQKLGVSTDLLNKKLTLQKKVLQGAQIELVKTTVKTVALQAVMSAGLSLVVGALVGGFTSLISGLTATSKNMGDLTASAQELKDAMQVDVSGLLKEYERLGTLAQDETKTAKEKLYYNEEMAKVKAELIATNSEYATILNDETKSLETQLNLIKAQNEERQKQKAQELDRELGLFDWTYNVGANKIEQNLKDQYEALLRYKEVYDQIKGSDTQTVINPITGYEQSVEQFLANFESAKEAFKESYSEADRLNGMVKAIGEAGEETGKKLIGGVDGLTEDYTNMFNSLGKGTLDAIGASAEELSTTYKTVEESTLALRATFQSLNNDQLSYAGVFEEVRAAIQEIGTEAGAQEEVVEHFLSTFPKYQGIVKDTNDILKIMGNEATIELGEAQAQARRFLETMEDMKNYTPEFAKQLKEAYPELALHIQDTAYVQEFLNDKISEMDDLYGVVMSQVGIYRTAQEEILANDEQFWNEKMKNSENFLQYQSAIESKLISMGAESLGIQYSDFAKFVESKGGLREIDYENAHTLAEAEDMTEAQKLISMLKKYSQYVNEKDGYRSADSRLIADFLNWQGESEASTIDELKDLWAAFYNAKKKEIEANLDYIRSMGDFDPAVYEQYKKLEEMNKKMTSGSLFSGIKTNFKGAGVSTYKGGLGSGGLGSSGLNTAPPPKGGSSGKDTQKVVEDLNLIIDRYYELNDALDDVNNALELNRQLQSSATDLGTTKKLHKEEIELLNKKLEAMKKLQLEQRNEMLDAKNLITSAGFKTDDNGNITNYSSRLQELQKYTNSLKGDAKEAQKAYVQSIVDAIEAYTTLTNSTIPSTEIAIEQLTQEIKDVNKEHEKTIQLIETLGDRYYEINGQIADVENKLALNQAQQKNATPSERVRLMKEEIALMKERQKLIMQQKSELETEANEIAKKLGEKGVEFNADGTIKNYKLLMQNLTTVANQYVGDTRDEMVEDAETLIDLIEQYDDIIRNTLPDLTVEWEEYTSSIREAEKAMAQTITDVQKDVTSAIKNELEKRTDAVKTELQKQKDAYNEQFEQEDWEDSLKSEQGKLDEIQQAINNLSRDTSLAGQLKLQQLREEYEAQQKVIDDMIREKEKENGNNRFDEEMEKLDKELEEALDPQNIADLVNKALVDGFVTIGDEVVALDSLMSDWLSETGDGLYAMGDILREELINNLRVAQELMAGMGIISTGVSTVDQNAITSDLKEQLNATLTSNGISKDKQPLSVTIGSLLSVDGNVTEDILPKLESMVESAKTELIEEIQMELLKR